MNVHDLPPGEMQALAPERCLEHRGDGSTCRGPVEYRYPLSGSGQSFPRCEAHWEARLVEQERIDRLYGGDVAPADFDPSYAGERWDDDY